MIGLDTSVLVRYLTQDDPAQTLLANRLIETTLSADQPGFISIVVPCELVWVLESAYGCDHAQMTEILDRLLRARPFVVERADLAWQAEQAFGSGRADFADCVIERIGNAAGCDHTLTFDRVAARNAGMRLLESRNA
jgi:predicted nucleic-acid-binding protein